MIQKTISILDIVESLSTAMDLISPSMMNHQRRVGYIAQKIAEEIGLPPIEQNNLLIAGFLHDCGALSLEEKFAAMRFENGLQTSALNIHAEAGYRLLKKFQPFLKAASAIRYHHRPWADGAGQESDKEPVPIASHILHLADRIDILIDQQQHILQQAKEIAKKIEKTSGVLLAPHLIEAFKSLAVKESFWLDIKSLTFTATWSGNSGFGHIRIDYDTLQELTAIFSQVIDFRSRFTATHSIGVSVCSVAMAHTLGMSENECIMMRIAGHFHDLGKLAVPKEILEKPSGLNEAEMNIVKAHAYYTKNILSKFRDLSAFTNWAAEHHERLDGQGYPFHFKNDALSLGSRIMAVADVFTAITEDRPYRKGMESPQAITILHNMAASQALDGDIVASLVANFDEINGVRVQAQAKTLQEYLDFRNPSPLMLG